MPPELTSFTDLDINPRTILARRLMSGPFPPSWERVEFEHCNNSLRSIIVWLAANINGRFGVIKNASKAAIYFENISDLMLFRMLDGDVEINKTQRVF